MLPNADSDTWKAIITDEVQGSVHMCRRSGCKRNPNRGASDSDWSACHGMRGGLGLGVGKADPILRAPSLPLSMATGP